MGLFWRNVLTKVSAIVHYSAQADVQDMPMTVVGPEVRLGVYMDTLSAVSTSQLIASRY